MIQKLIIHPSSACTKDCPFCYLPSADGPVREPSFFQSLLEHAQAVPEWLISVGSLPPLPLQASLRVFSLAWRLGHPYAVATHFENLLQLDPQIFSRARRVILGVDDYKVGTRDWLMLSQTLAWSRRQAWNLEIEISLTPGMLEQLLRGMMLEKFLESATKVRFVVPKSEAYPFLHQDRFGDFLDFAVEKIRRNWISSRQLEVENCLMPMLGPAGAADPACPREKSLTVLPDGSLRICPFGRRIGLLEEPESIAGYLARGLSAQEQSDLRDCRWRGAWRAREDPGLYSWMEQNDQSAGRTQAFCGLGPKIPGV